MAWAMAIFLLLLGTCAVCISLVELLPKIGYILCLCAGLSIIGIGLAGVSDLSKPRADAANVIDR